MWTTLDVNRYAPGDFYKGKSRVLLERWTAARALGLSPDGTRLAFGGGESYESRGLRAHRAVVVLVETATGREVQRLSGHTDAVISLAFSDDGLRLCSVGDRLDATVKLWDAATGACLATRALKDGPGLREARRAAWLADGGVAAAGLDGLATFTGRLKPAGELLRARYAAELLAVSGDGRRAVTVSGGRVPPSFDAQPPRDGALVAWDLAEAAVTSSRAIDPPLALAMSRDGASTAVIHAPGAPAGAEAWRVASARLYNSGMFHPVERYLDPTFSKRVSVFDGPALTPRWSLDLGGHIQAAVFSPDGAELGLVGRRERALVLLRVRASDGDVLSEHVHPDPVCCDVACVALGAGSLVAGTYFHVARFAYP